jgi:hypothetical protein
MSHYEASQNDRRSRDANVPIRGLSSRTQSHFETSQVKFKARHSLRYFGTFSHFRPNQLHYAAVVIGQCCTGKPKFAVLGPCVVSYKV